MASLSVVTVTEEEADEMCLTQDYAWHQALWQAFPGHPAGQRPFLFRVDPVEDTYRVYLLASGRPQPPVWGTWKTKELPDSFFQHKRYIFTLRGNPTVKRAVQLPDGTYRKNSRRVALREPEAITSWLQRRSSAAGFDVLETSIGAPVDRPFYRKGQRGVHCAVDFHGVLEVSDSAAFTGCVLEGVGSAKAFGFGLLLLKPVAC